MRTFWILSFVLLSAGPLQAECFQDRFLSLMRTLSGRTPQEAVFKPYYAGGKATGWKDTITDLSKTNGGPVGLGGNDGNTFSVSLADGSTVVTKQFPEAALEHHAKVLQQLKDWEKRGVGPEVLGVSLLGNPGSTQRGLFLVLEDLLAAKNDYGTKVSGGNGRAIRLLRGESPEARKWVLEKLQSELATHPDPHPMNAIFRVTRLKPSGPLPPEGSYYRAGDKIYQVFLVDPSGAQGNPDNPIFNTDIEKTPEVLRQYNHQWKRQYFEKELGLQ